MQTYRNPYRRPAAPAPSSSTASLEDMTKAELLDLAAERNIEGRSSMSKPDLIAALS